MKSLLKIFMILTPRQLRRCVLLFVAMFAAAVMEAAGISLLYPLIAIISTPDFLERHARVARAVGALGITTHKSFTIFCAGGLLAFFIFKNAFVFLQTRLQINFSMNNQRDYARRLYAYYLSKPYLFHVNINSATLIRNVTEGSQCAFQTILVNTLLLATEALTALTIVATLFAMDWGISLIVIFAFGPLIFFLLKALKRRITAQGVIKRAAYAEFMKWLHQGLGSVKETKVMRKEKYFARRFGESYAKYSDSQRDYMVMDKIPRPVIELVGMGCFIALVIVKIASGSDPLKLIPTLGVLALAAVRLMPSATRMLSYFTAIRFAMPLLNEMYDDFMLIKKNKDMDERRAAQKDKGPMVFQKEISVENLSFKYPGAARDVFTGVSFKIPKGSFVGIVGQSGAGKTTFVDILLGLLPPESGRICVDGVDMAQNISGWLDNVSYVPQSIYLVDGTIKENIALGVSECDIDDARIETVLKMAELYDFVQSLPEKENTVAGELGSRLSGGQKQRIGIARALYKNPSALILDEATSALDNETEKSITDTILKLKGSVTIISIAHRTSMLEQCDFKIKFGGGAAERMGM